MLEGAFDIEVTMPVWHKLAVKPLLTGELSHPPAPSAIIGIVFEKGTDVAVATKEIYDALIDLGLIGSC